MMQYQALFLVLLLTAAAVVLSAPPAGAMKDPSAVYCEAMGYTYTVASMPQGPLGVCVLPDGTKVDSFRFLQGSEGIQYSYCAREGFRQQVVTSYRTCGHFGLDQCLVCILPDGTTTEVTRLMNLSFAETTCGDGSCGMPENFISCPADCRSGDWDNLCDRVRDGRCDPDCADGAGDPDCVEVPDYRVILGIAAIVITGVAVILFLKKKKGTN